MTNQLTADDVMRYASPTSDPAVLYANCQALYTIRGVYRSRADMAMGQEQRTLLALIQANAEIARLKAFVPVTPIKRTVKIKRLSRTKLKKWSRK